MPNKTVEQLANDFIRLMPMIRKNFFKPFDKTAKATLSPMQVQILFFLKGKEALPMSEIAAKMNVLKQQLTFLTDKLAENNFIERVHDQKDRRSVKISITQDGIEFLAELHQQMLEILTSKFEQLADEDINELQAAIRSMFKVLSRLN